MFAGGLELSPGLLLTGEPWFTYTVVMSNKNLIINIRIELQKLNHVIDMKIIKGLPYRVEAKRHKFLLARLADLTASPRVNWWGRLAQAMSTAMF